MKILFILAALALVPSTPVFAQGDGDPDTWTLVEPTTTVGGAPLVALDGCQVTATGEFPAYAPQSKPFPASSPNGGGSHAFRISDIYGYVGQGRVDLVATCSNSGGTSEAALASDTFPIGEPQTPGLHP